MKTSATKLAMVFIFLVQLVLAQDAHEQFESTFSDLTINQVVETLKIKKRYAEEATVQALVDTEYSSFQNFLHDEMESDTQLNKMDIEIRIQHFLSELNIKVNQTPKNPSENGPVKMWDGPCVNMDFEDGDLNGWTLSIGETDGSVMYSYVNDLPAGPGPNHQIYGGGIDPVVGINRVNAGGSFSVRLGNGTTSGAGAARMSQSFMVDASNYFFTYNYAVVFENPNGHTPQERPYFTVRVFDELGVNIPCGEYSVYADPLNATDFQSVGGILYKDWTSVFTNLSAYIGQNVTVEFTTGDCSLGGHYAYAYLDASCDLQQITATDYDICPGQTSTLTAPGGIGNYLWSTGETTQSIIINAGGTYTCLLTPLQGAGCSVLLDVTIIEFEQPTADFSLDNSTVCIGTPVVFTDNSSIPAPGAIATYQWDFDNGVITPSSNGPIVAVLNTSGTYTNPTHDFAASGIYNPVLTIVSSDGCTDSFTTTVTINPTPVVVAGLDQTVCFGQQVTLSGAGATSYSWDNGVVDGIAFTPAVGSILYTVTGTNAQGCSTTDQVQVTAHALPNVNAGTDQVVCFGDQVTLSATGAPAFIWDNGVIDGVSFSPAVGTVIYTVTGTDVNGCVDLDDVQVIVHALPIVNAGIDQEICVGEQVTLTGSGADSYVWNNGVVNATAFTPATGSINYMVVGTDGNGCMAADFVQVIVHALPIVNAGLDQTFCEGNQLTLAGSGATVYSWNHGVIDNVSFVPAIGTQTYTVTGTDINGCEDTDIIQVTVNPNPQVEAGANITICAGESALLTASGATNYNWTNGVQNGVIFFPAVGTQQYIVTGTFITGCSATDSLIITVNPKPIVSANDVNICRGEAAILQGQGADAYLWSHGITDNAPFYPSSSGNYVVTGFNLFGCSATAEAHVFIHDYPTASFNPQDYELNLLTPGTTFLNTSTGASNYVWNFNDGSVISNEVSPFHSFPSEDGGSYVVELVAISDFGCSDTTIRIIEIKDELILFVPNTFTPDNDMVNNNFTPVFAAGFDPQGYTLYIFNRWGQLVFESHDTNIGWNGSYGVGGEYAQDGTYSWKIIVKEEHTPKNHIFVGHVNLLR